MIQILDSPAAISPGTLRNKGIDIERQKRNKKRATSIYPSSISRCTREIVYNMTIDMPETKKDTRYYDGLRRMATGNAVHDRVAADHERAGVLVEKDLKLEYLDRMNGEIDEVLEIDGKEYVLEVKTVNVRRFKAIKKEGRLEKSMVMQILYYMYRMKMPGWLYIENKDTQEYLEYFYPTHDLPLFKELMHKVNVINYCFMA